MAAERPAGPDPRMSMRVEWVAVIDAVRSGLSGRFSVAQIGTRSPAWQPPRLYRSLVFDRYRPGISMRRDRGDWGSHVDHQIARTDTRSKRQGHAQAGDSLFRRARHCPVEPKSYPDGAARQRRRHAAQPPARLDRRDWPDA